MLLRFLEETLIKQLGIFPFFGVPIQMFFKIIFLCYFNDSTEIRNRSNIRSYLYIINSTNISVDKRQRSNATANDRELATNTIRVY